MNLNSTRSSGWSLSPQSSTFQMHPYVLLLLLCGWTASSHYLPPKEMPLLQNTTKSALIDEMLCLLENENTTLNEPLTTPICVKCTDCACDNTEKFIHQLNTLESPCMKIVKSDMRKLRDSCSIMKRKSAHGNSCCEMKVDFPHFRNKLEDFLKWLSQMGYCKNIVRDESDLDDRSKSSCSLPCTKRLQEQFPQQQWGCLGMGGKEGLPQNRICAKS